MTAPPSEALAAPPGADQAAPGPGGTSHFDFRSPAPLNEARLEAVTAAHRRWVDALAERWRDLLPDQTTVELGDVNRTTIAAVCPPDAPPCHAAVIPTERRDSPVVLMLPVDLAHVMVDRILGGPGELLADVRPVTEIEQRLIADAVDAGCASLAELYQLPAAGHFETHPALGPLELDASGPTALTVVVGIGIGSRALALTVIVPAGSIGPITDVLVDAGDVDETEAHDAESRRRALARLVDVPVEVGVRFCPSAMASSKILSVQVGDLVSLGTPATGLLDLVIDGLRVALVRPARNGDGLACQVVAALEVPEPIDGPPSDPARSPHRHPGAS